jgi:3-phenylpropionate/trans-cinnamate dioxygenase ferredoxin component
MPRIVVCRAERLRPGGRRLLEAEGHQVVVLNTGERLHAVQNRCPHAGAQLFSAGELRGCTLTCRWHDLRFDLSTGASDAGFELRVYPTGIDELGRVWVELPESPEK